MQSQNWNDIYNDTGEESYDKFIAADQNIYQQSFPLVRVSRKRWHDRPWLSKDLKICLKHKNKLYEEYILHPDGLHKTKYNVYKNCLCKCLLEAETNYYNELFENNKILIDWTSLFRHFWQSMCNIQYIKQYKDSVFNLWKTLNPIRKP